MINVPEHEVRNLQDRIMRGTSSKEREWDKVEILQADKGYMGFLSRLTGTSQHKILGFMGDYTSDLEFRRAFAPQLADFESSDQYVHGDVRFHSVTLYVATRALRPTTVIETGVASGKSSAVLLLALHHNRGGHLLSIDLPNEPHATLEDGAGTHTAGRAVGWLVPSYLRDRWELVLGDSRTALPSLAEKHAPIDFFFHDSLHTYEHVAFELNAVWPNYGEGGLILVDNIDISAPAFDDFARSRSLGSPVAYGSMGGVLVSVASHDD